MAIHKGRLTDVWVTACGRVTRKIRLVLNGKSSVHEHHLPQRSPDRHLLIALQWLLLGKAVVEKFHDIVLQRYQGSPGNESELSLDRQRHFGCLAARAAAGERGRSPNPEKAVHLVDSGNEFMLTTVNI